MRIVHDAQILHGSSSLIPSKYLPVYEDSPNAVELFDLEEKDHDLTIQIKARIPHLGVKTGSRIFVNLALPTRIGWGGEHPSRRTHAYDAGLPSTYTSQIALSYSGNLELESLPREVLLETPFGSYQHHYTKVDSSLETKRSFRDTQPIIPIEDYKAYFQFRQKTKSANSSQIVFIKR